MWCVLDKIAKKIIVKIPNTAKDTNYISLTAMAGMQNPSSTLQKNLEILDEVKYINI